MLISFECQMKTDGGMERWDGIITRLLNHGCHFESTIESRSGITVLFGETSQGNFACMPDYNVGCHLVNLQDKFLYTERLTAVLGEVDGITVAEVLYALEIGLVCNILVSITMKRAVSMTALFGFWEVALPIDTDDDFHRILPTNLGGINTQVPPRHPEVSASNTVFPLFQPTDTCTRF